MDRELERRLARLEGKINLIAKAIAYVLAIVIGFSVYFFFSGDELAGYYGFAAGVIAGGVFEWQIRSLEKFLPNNTPSGN